MTQHIVISEAFGGFGISEAGVARVIELGTDLPGYGSQRNIARDNPHLVQVVRELGNAASGRYAKLVIVEIPDGVEWHIHEYDGSETVHEDHRSWDSSGLSDYC